MRYTIDAGRNGAVATFKAESEEQALDIIDDLVAAGFGITSVIDQDGAIIPTIEVLERFLLLRKAPRKLR